MRRQRRALVRGTQGGPGMERFLRQAMDGREAVPVLSRRTEIQMTRLAANLTMLYNELDFLEYTGAGKTLEGLTWRSAHGLATA